MTHIALDDLERARLDWPEPVLIDLIGELYGEAPNASDRIVAARLHVRFLHELIEGQPRGAAFMRLELIACCAARGIGIDAIEEADHAAFRELTRIIASRFRNSSRLRDHFVQRIDDAIQRLPERSQPLKRPATIRRFVVPRINAVRPPQRIGQQLAVSG